MAAILQTFKCVIFKHILVTDILNILCEIVQNSLLSRIHVIQVSMS